MVHRYDRFFPNHSISLYLHWPFCLSKCPYCAFNSTPIQDLIDYNQWEQGFFFALKEAAAETSSRPVRSIYFGGGTPSLLPAGFIADVLNQIAHLWPIDPKVEITLEMNPGRITSHLVAAFKEAGINRVSLGVQSLTNEGLAILGRRHTVEESLLALAAITEHFENFTFDMMYAWPGHTLDMWKGELGQALSYQAPHMSIYQLVVENNSVFGSMYHRGELLLPDEDVCADMFEFTQEATEQNGLPAYEISNHARPGFESIHNIGYWLYKDYIGIGPGAHSRLTLDGRKFAMVHETNPQKWLVSILNNHKVLQEKAELTPEEQVREALLVGLRMTNGVDTSKLALPLKDVIDPEALKYLEEERYISYDGSILCATATGRERLNALTAYLIR